jgi:hypothetical protein
VAVRIDEHPAGLELAEAGGEAAFDGREVAHLRTKSPSLTGRFDDVEAEDVVSEGAGWPGGPAMNQRRVCGIVAVAPTVAVTEGAVDEVALKKSRFCGIGIVDDPAPGRSDVELMKVCLIIQSSK